MIDPLDQVKLLETSGYIYKRGGMWEHPLIVYEDGSGLKQWTLHEAYMYEMYDVWVRP